MNQVQADTRGVAIGDLYQRHAPALLSHCRGLLGEAADAADAMHEAFVRVLNRERFNPGNCSLGYLYRASTNSCIDLLRQRVVRRCAAAEIAARGLAAIAVSPRMHEDRECARLLLERCDHTTASIGVMHFMQEMNQVEIASVLGVSRRTVFNHLKRLERVAGEMLADADAAAS